jgi:hypothetical protein
VNFVDIIRLLPRSAVHELGYSLIPGTIFLFGVSWIRWDLVTKFLAFTLIDPVSKAVLVLFGVLTSGYLLFAFVGGVLTVVFVLLGATFGAISKSRRTTEDSYGTSIVWRRLASSLLGEHISEVREAGWSREQFQERLKASFDKHIHKQSEIDQEQLKVDLTRVVFGETADLAAGMLKQAETNSEWQSVYRILNEYFEYPQRNQIYSMNVLLSTGTVLWTLYHFWLTALFPLWVAGFAVTAWGIFHAMTYGFFSALSDRAKGPDEKQAVRILSVMIPPAARQIIHKQAE